MKRLLRKGDHNTPLVTVCVRAGVGEIDQYGRGVWVCEENIPEFVDFVRKNGKYVNQGGFEAWYVDGTNRHNHVLHYELEKWLKEERRKKVVK